jgi:hypothetical protein
MFYPVQASRCLFPCLKQVCLYYWKHLSFYSLCIIVFFLPPSLPSYVSLQNTSTCMLFSVSLILWALYSHVHKINTFWHHVCTVLISLFPLARGIVLGYRLDDRGSRVRFPVGAGNFSLHHRVQNGSRAHPATYPMGIRGTFPGGEATRVCSWPPTSI